MDRRRFLGISIGAAMATLLPMNLNAVNFRKEKPKAWTAKKVDEAIKEVFG